MIFDSNSTTATSVNIATAANLMREKARKSYAHVLDCVVPGTQNYTFATYIDDLADRVIDGELAAAELLSTLIEQAAVMVQLITEDLQGRW